MAVASDASWGGVSSPELCFCVAPLWILIPNWCLALAVLQLPHAGARDIPEHRPLAGAWLGTSLLGLSGTEMHFPRRT